MKTLVLLLCLALVGATVNTAQAQDRSANKPSAEEMATKKTTKLTEVLSLTKEQQTQVHSIVLTKINKHQELKNTRLTEDERRAGMKEVRANFDAQLKGILTAEQMAKYEAHNAEMKKNKHGHQHKGKGPHPKGK